uniref:Putative bpti/kunitz family of serine protease inhibitor n=1 Tax=Amblyomma americanum TaxID=6943 RepID=A0A0C9S3A3_AMBAM
MPRSLVVVALLLAIVVAGTNAQGQCFLPPSQGPCRGAFPAFYFDSRSGRCLPFTYGGCGGNANRFNSVGQCRRVCGRY